MSFRKIYVRKYVIIMINIIIIINIININIIVTAIKIMIIVIITVVIITIIIKIIILFAPAHLEEDPIVAVQTGVVRIVVQSELLPSCGDGWLCEQDVLHLSPRHLLRLGLHPSPSRSTSFNLSCIPLVQKERLLAP